MSKAIDDEDWASEAYQYIAMSAGLVLFPHGKTSTDVWDMEDDRRIGVLEGHTDPVSVAAINNDATAAVTMSSDDNGDTWAAKLWSLDTMQCTSDLTSVYGVGCLLKDRLLLDSESRKIKVWDIGGCAPVALMDLGDHDSTVLQIEASDTSNAALSGSFDGSMRLWDLRSGQCVRIMEGHAGLTLSVSLDSASKTAVSGSHDDTVKLWDLGSGRCIHTYQYHGCGVCDVMMHESGSSFLTFGPRLSIKAWTTASGYDQPILAADLGLYCNPNANYVRGAASWDLSRVAVCYMQADGLGRGIQVWK